MNQEIINKLKKKLNPKFVKERAGMSYIEGWRAEDEANEVFDFQWDSEVLDLTENTPPTLNHNENNVVSFRAKVRVTAHGVYHDGIGYGDGVGKDIHKCYEGAIKEAETDAEKRALKKFGNRFGLALYDKLQEGVGVDEPTAEEKQVLTDKWVNEYLKKLEIADPKTGADEADLKALQGRNKTMLKRVEDGYPELHRVITRKTEEIEPIPSPSNLT